MTKCLNCGKTLTGRIDKKYCSVHCKSTFHNGKNRSKEKNLFKKVDEQLRHNRRILKEYIKSGKEKVQREVMIEEGFNPKYFTHYWKSKEGDVYLFCYEYGFITFTEEEGKSSFALVPWQDYMGEI